MSYETVRMAIYLIGFGKLLSAGLEDKQSDTYIPVLLDIDSGVISHGNHIRNAKM